MTWPSVALGELLDVKHGFAFKGEHFEDAGQYVLLTPGSFREEGGFLDQGEKTKYYTGDIPDGYVLDEGDLIIAMTEQAPGLLGSSALIPEGDRFLHNQRLGRIVGLDESRLSRRFLYYLFNTREVRQQISATATGGKVRHTAPERIRKVTVRLPPIASQVRIAEVLSAYDDLVGVNSRRMALLESSVAHIYREWFVRLRYPGSEDRPVVAGVPEGWERTTAAAAMDIRSGGTPKTAIPEYWDGQIGFYTPKDAVDTCYVSQTERQITEIGLRSCNSQLFDVDTVFISARGTVGKLNLALHPMAMSQSCYALVGKGHISQYFLYCALGDAIEQFKQHAVGAVFDAIVVDTFSQIPFLVPAEGVLRDFDKITAPMFRQIANLLQQNERLCAARDLILPRLMSGELTA